VIAICIDYTFVEACVDWFISHRKVTRASLKTSPIGFPPKPKNELSITESGARRDSCTHTWGTTIHHEDSVQICFYLE
jgi:hypothetical protein